MKNKTTLIAIAVVCVLAYLYYRNKKKHVCGCDKGIGDPSKCKCGGAKTQSKAKVDPYADNEKIVTEEKINEDVAKQSEELNDEILVDKKAPLLVLNGEEIYQKWLDSLKNGIEMIKQKVKTAMSDTEKKQLEKEVDNETEFLNQAEKIYHAFLDSENKILEDKVVLYIEGLTKKGYHDLNKNILHVSDTGSAIVLCYKDDENIENIKHYCTEFYPMLSRD